MKNLHELNGYRRCDWELRANGTVGDSKNGCFVVPLNGAELAVIATSGGGWDHISVSTAARCPTWEEMEHIRKLFGLPHETWLQFGVPESEHINCHPYCLHWWRPQHREVKLPPPEFVGPRAVSA